MNDDLMAWRTNPPLRLSAGDAFDCGLQTVNVGVRLDADLEVLVVEVATSGQAHQLLLVPEAARRIVRRMTTLLQRLPDRERDACGDL
jgi:hypothetical protein